MAYSIEDGCNMRDFFAVRAELERARADQRQIQGEADQIRARITAGQDTGGLRERLNNLEAGIEPRDLQTAELEAEWGRRWPRASPVASFRKRASRSRDASR